MKKLEEERVSTVHRSYGVGCVDIWTCDIHVVVYVPEEAGHVIELLSNAPS